MRFMFLTLISILSMLFSCNLFQAEFMTRPSESIFYANSIFDTSPDCTLPCLMGLAIGSVPDAESISRLDRIEQQLGGIRDSGDDVITYFIPTEPEGGFTTSIYFQGELIQSIELDLSNPESWLSPMPFTFDNVLSQLGSPDEVYIYFFGPPAGYTLLLVYETERIVLQYRFRVEIPERYDGGEPIPFCPLESPVTTLIRLNISVRNLDSENWLLDVVPDLFDEIETRAWRQLSDLTEFDQQSLFDSLDSGCVDLTTFEALRALGYQY